MTGVVGMVVASPGSVEVHRDEEIDRVCAAVAAAGIAVRAVPWTAQVDWSQFEAVVLKSPWDYSMRSAEFSAWLAAVAGVTTVVNHPDLIRWNFDKRYLAELGSCGVRVTPFVAVTSQELAAAEFARRGEEVVVVKPTVSAGSRNTGLFRADDPRALELTERVLALGKTPMIMAALESVGRLGEHGLLYFGGEYSHAGRKAPILELGGGYRGGRYTEIIEPARPSQDEVDLGASCLRAVAELARARGLPARSAMPLYARIDIARDDEGYACVLEAEMFEPNYFTRIDPGGAARFATALARLLEDSRGAA